MFQTIQNTTNLTQNSWNQHTPDTGQLERSKPDLTQTVFCMHRSIKWKVKQEVPKPEDDVRKDKIKREYLYLLRRL